MIADLTLTIPGLYKGNILVLYLSNLKVKNGEVLLLVYVRTSKLSSRSDEPRMEGRSFCILRQSPMQSPVKLK